MLATQVSNQSRRKRGNDGCQPLCRRILTVLIASCSAMGNYKDQVDVREFHSDGDLTSCSLMGLAISIGANCFNAVSDLYILSTELQNCHCKATFLSRSLIISKLLHNTPTFSVIIKPHLYTITDDVFSCF